MTARAQAFGLTPDQLLERLTAAALEPVQVTDGQLDLGGLTAIGELELVDTGMVDLEPTCRELIGEDRAP